MATQAKKSNIIKKFFILLPILFLTMLTLFGCAKSDNKNDKDKKIDYTTITAEQGKAMLENGGVILVDVRTKSEYEQGHIKDAILLPNETIESQAPSVLTDLKAVIIVYCRSGNRSATAAKKLVKLGYENVYDMGGIQAWQASEYDIMV